MREFYNAVVRQTLVLMFIYLAMGLFFVIKPDTTFEMITRIASIAMIVFGLFRIILYFISRAKSMYGYNGLATGMILAAIGLYFLLKPSSIQEIISVMLAFGVLIGAIMILQASLDLLHFGSHMWTFLMIFAILGIIFFVVSLYNPFSTSKLLIRLVGAGMLVESLSYGIALILLFLIRTNIKEAEQKPGTGAADGDSGAAVPSGKDKDNGFESQTHFGDPILDDDGYIDPDHPDITGGMSGSAGAVGANGAGGSNSLYGSGSAAGIPGAAGPNSLPGAGTGANSSSAST
ncbi:MAG: DUF308 domain-containing protein, partial [Lachnospiraceae bacterium]|nr:DUF308 domain-containing protein [Lachnospiraceae bacterium]